MNDSLTYSDYWNHIDSTAREIVEECSSDLDKITEAIYSAVDCDSWVIYTHRALAVLQHTTNDDAFFAQGMTLDACEDASSVYTTLAHYAMLEDVSERVQGLL